MKKMLKRDWIGREVETTVTLRTNGGTLIAAGTIMKVVSAHRGFELVKDRICPTCMCGREMRIRNVEEYAVRLLPIDSVHVASTTD